MPAQNGPKFRGAFKTDLSDFEQAIVRKALLGDVVIQATNNHLENADDPFSLYVKVLTLRVRVCIGGSGLGACVGYSPTDLRAVPLMRA